MRIKTFCLDLFLSVFLVALLATITGCIVEPVGGRVYEPAPIVQVQPAVVVADGLIYYPNYEVYYDPGARVYWYSRRGAWVTGPAPEGISVDVLVASPSVRLDFRDSPANHHNEIVRQYPHGWQPPGRERR